MLKILLDNGHGEDTPGKCCPMLPARFSIFYRRSKETFNPKTNCYGNAERTAEQ